MRCTGRSLQVDNYALFSGTQSELSTKCQDFSNKCRGHDGQRLRRSGQGSRRSGQGLRRSGRGSRRSCQGSRRSGQGSRRSGQGSRRSGQGHGGRVRGHDGRVGGHGGRIRDSQVTTVGIGGPYAGEGVALFASPHRRHRRRRRHGTSSCLTNHDIVHTCVHLSVIGDVTASSVLYNYYTTAFMEYSNCKHLFRQCDPVEYFSIDQSFTSYCALCYEC